MEGNEKINEKKEVCEHKNRQNTNCNGAAAHPKDRTGIGFHDDGPFGAALMADLGVDGY